jgi:hypothetical protein
MHIKRLVAALAVSGLCLLTAASLALPPANASAEFARQSPTIWEVVRANPYESTRTKLFADDDAPAQKPAEQCEPAWKRHCSDQCNGQYGLFCMFLTVCDPEKHRCVKPEP